MDQLLQTLLTGMTTGSIYAIAALGFSIVFNATKVTNFANGEFVMIGGLLSASLILGLGLHPILAILLACAATTLLGALIDILGIQHARRKNVLSFAMITIGLGITYRGFMQTFVSSEILFPPVLGGIPTVFVGDLYLSGQNIWILLLLAVVSAALSVMFLRTKVGKAMRAASQQPRAAMLCGIDPRLMSTLAFGMAGLLGAVAGCLIAPIGGAFYGFGLFYGLKGFAAAVLGGFGSSVGAVVGGLLIGVIEATTASYLSSDYKDAAGLLVLIAVLLLRPSGLFGRVEARRV